VAIDNVSKWVEAGAIPNKSADRVKRWIWEKVICRFGAPEEVITDNGREFMGNFAALMASCDTAHITTQRHGRAHESNTER
jgi:hypothetical protein